MSLITDLVDTVNVEVEHYVFDGYHAIVSLFSTTLTTLLIIYFAGLGWLIIRGLLPLAPLAIAWHMLKAAFIFTLALHWDYFSYFFVNFFMHGADRMISVMLTNSGGSPEKMSLINGLSNVWEEGSNVFVNVLRVSGSDFMLGTLMGFLGCLIITGIVGVALFYIVMSKIALSVLLVLAPIILPMFLWGHTRGIFNSWLRLLVQWLITPVMIYAFVGLYLKLIQAQIDLMAKAPNGPTTAGVLAFTLVGVIAIATFKQAGNMSRDIAGGINLADLGTQTHSSIPGMAWRAWQEHRVK